MLKGNTTASEIQRSICCSYDTNFKFMVIQHTHEHQQLCRSLGFPHARTEFMMLKKMKRTSIKGNKFEPKTIFWAHARELKCQ
jgi:hypothetical protein